MNGPGTDWDIASTTMLQVELASKSKLPNGAFILTHHGKLYQYRYAVELRCFDLKQSYPKSDEYLTISNHTEKHADVTMG